MKIKKCGKCSSKEKLKLNRLKRFNGIVKPYIENYGCELLTSSEDYKDQYTPLKIKCNCGEIFITDYNHFKYQNKRTCNKCSNKNKKLFKSHTYEYVKSYIESYGCELLSKDYKNNTDKLKIKCNCGEIFITDFATFKGKRKTRCTRCSSKMSSYEREVEHYLKENSINYEMQYKFDDCRKVLPLPFDFYLTDFNICIEVDGEGHFEKMRFKEYDLQDVILRDNIKTQYCNDNNIKLIRIPYFDILNHKFKNELNKLIPR